MDKVHEELIKEMIAIDRNYYMQILEDFAHAVSSCKRKAGFSGEGPFPKEYWQCLYDDSNVRSTQMAIIAYTKNFLLFWSRCIAVNSQVAVENGCPNHLLPFFAGEDLQELN